MGENVAIGCAHGALQTIRLVPLAGGSSHPVPYVHVTTKLAPPTGTGAKASMVWSSGTITPSNSGTGRLLGGRHGHDLGGDYLADDERDHGRRNYLHVLCVRSEIPSFDIGLVGLGLLAVRLSTRQGVEVGDSADLSCTYSGTSSSGKLTVR